MEKNEQIDIKNLPNVEILVFKKISKNYLKVILLNLILFASILFTGLFLFDKFVLTEKIPKYTYLFYIALSILFLLLFGYFYIGFSRRKYAVREKDVSYKSGVFLQELTTVPFTRIQHIEINEGLFSRWFKLASVVIFTAGASGQDLSIKGISKEKALKIKSFISQKINE